MIVLKYLCLFVAIMYGFGNVVRAFRNQTISGFQIFLMAGGIVGYVLLEFELGF